ncbi:hypothetical protein JCM33374_g5592 [Metschnikowia sp. JCM 33374]|nr:hypothetical protein JCM33374_g5592 [Metschnikowia sp. JCM 33374]
MSSTKIQTVSATHSELRSRAQNTSDPKTTANTSLPSGGMRSAEEILIEKLDAFLSSIEHRLDRFDQYFKLSGDGILEDEGTPELQPSTDNSPQARRSSSASLSSLKSFSMYNLNKVYEQLSMVKDQVLKTSVLNLEYLYKTLDDKYNYLFNQDGDEHPESTQPSYMESLTSNREILTNKIITNLTYFEQKLSHIDALIKSKTPQATANYDEDAKFNRYRFFNFNRALKAAQKGYLHYYQLPLSWRENRYIIHGYRFNLSHREMWKSMFHFNHNESANIWTHVLGALTICYLGLVHFPSTDVYANNSRMGNTMMFIFILAALECLVSSVLWHTYSCFAQLKIRNRFACVDYTGITVLITCSVIAVEYCSLYNYTKLFYSFMAVSIASGLAGFLFNWSPYFDRPDCRPFRIGFFVSLAFLGATTFLCKWYYEGIVTAFYFYSPLVYKSFIWYWAGVVFYGGLIPERWRYDIIINEDDICGHEHNASDVLTGNIEHSGEEELQEVQASMASACSKHGHPHQDGEAEHPASPQSPASDSVTGTPEGKDPYTGSTREICEPQLCTGGVTSHDAASSAAIGEVKHCEEIRQSDKSGKGVTCTCVPAALDDETMQKNDILRRHFPESPIQTPYHKDFLSLWWVDYILHSHNIWHVFVVLGVVGHYFCLLGMYGEIHLLQSVSDV